MVRMIKSLGSSAFGSTVGSLLYRSRYVSCQEAGWGYPAAPKWESWPRPHSFFSAFMFSIRPGRLGVLLPANTGMSVLPMPSRWRIVLATPSSTQLLPMTTVTPFKSTLGDLAKISKATPSSNRSTMSASKMTGIFSGACATGALAAETVTVIAVTPNRAAMQVVCNKRFQVFIKSLPSDFRNMFSDFYKKVHPFKNIIH